jgi:hypothetical protein
MDEISDKHHLVFRSPLYVIHAPATPILFGFDPAGRRLREADDRCMGLPPRRMKNLGRRKATEVRYVLVVKGDAISRALNQSRTIVRPCLVITTSTQ